MVKDTLYNIGEPKEVVFIIIFYTYFVLVVCISNMLKEPKEDMYLETRISMLRILPLRAQAFKSIISIQMLRYLFSHIASTLYMNQSMMASPCKLNKNIFYVHVNKRTHYVNNILYIYIIYVNMKRITSKFLNIRKKFLTSLLIFIILYIVRKLTTTVGFIVMNFIVVISY